MLCVTMGACSQPRNGTLTYFIPVYISNHGNQGTLMVSKLDENCGQQEASFRNIMRRAKKVKIIGNATEVMYVEAGVEFSFQLNYSSSNSVSCEVRDTIPARPGGANYKIFFTAPQVGDAPDKKCTARLEMLKSPIFVFLPAEFSGRCSKAE